MLQSLGHIAGSPRDTEDSQKTTCIRTCYVLGSNYSSFVAAARSYGSE